MAKWSLIRTQTITPPKKGYIQILETHVFEIALLTTHHILTRVG